MVQKVSGMSTAQNRPALSQLDQLHPTRKGASLWGYHPEPCKQLHVKMGLDPLGPLTCMHFSVHILIPFHSTIARKSLS